MSQETRKLGTGFLASTGVGYFLGKEFLGKMNNNSDKACAHVMVSGRVQGVAFRYYARNIAYQLGIKGWIKNLANGDVELVIAGRQESVKKMVEWCKKGPRMAIVENTEVDWLPYSGEYNLFQIKT